MAKKERIKTCVSDETPRKPKRYIYVVELAAVACYSAIDNHPVYQDWQIGYYDSIEKAVAAREKELQRYADYERIPNAEYHKWEIDGYPQYITTHKSALYEPTYFRIMKCELE